MSTTLFERFDAMSVRDHPRNRQPNNRPQEEDSVSGDDFATNPFAEYLARVRDRGPMVQNYESRRWENGLKIDIPEFQGGLTTEEFLDWVATVEEILDFKEVPDSKRVLLVATRFQEGAAAW